MNAIPRFLLPALLTCRLTTVHAATDVLNYSPSLHDRFDSASFIASGFDLSGIARSSDANARWATMLSPNTFISANHYKPSNGSTLTFHLDNSSTGPTVTRTVASGVRIGTTDLWIGKLASPVPASVAVYGLASTPVDLSTGLGPYADEFVYQVGLRGAQGTGGTTNFLVGVNNIETGDSTSVALGTFDVIGFVRDQAGDTNLHDPGETFLQGGDSGAPSFLVDNGELKLVGIHSYIEASLDETDPNFANLIESQSPNSPFNRPGNQTRNISFDNFVPNYQSEILAAIPEPGTVGLLMVAMATLGLIRKWRPNRRD